MSQVEVEEHLISNQIITAVIVYGPKRTDIKDLRKGRVTEHSIKSAKYHANAIQVGTIAVKYINRPTEYIDSRRSE